MAAPAPLRRLQPTPARPISALLSADMASPSSSTPRSPIPPLSPVDSDALADSLHDLTDTDAEFEPMEHPFAHTTQLIQVVHDSGEEHIDIAAERAFYDQFPGLDERASLDGRPSLDGVRSVSGRSLDGRSLFSADIMLGESLGESKTFARDVRIGGWTTVGKTYVVYDCVITTKEGLVIHALKRYSAFEKLASALRRSLPKAQHKQIPRLPPKNPLAKHRPAFLERRRRMLQAWLLAVLLHPVLGATDAAREWVLD
ncbi:hypothetical protein AURDEDRAFT_116028 [Auricularia subglabra TFB-10046 SS5]|nr:hypothetical protein AURDEDRAFT_116028 [Auricularia subglabra TFB-10046 SS5]